MSTRDTSWPAGTPNWVDISVPDIDAALQFYGSVVGWSFAGTDAEYGGYRMCQVDGRSVAGIGPMQAAEQPTAWLVYLASDDADASAKLITENGGTLLADPFDLDGVGRIAVARDSTGGAFGVFHGREEIGTQVVDEPGCMVWEDARLTDVAEGRRFYQAVFGYTYEPVPGMDFEGYGTFSIDGRPGGGMGGMMGAAEGTPSHWVVYFSVPDVDTALAAAERGGGRVLMAAQDTPYGRMAVVNDPFGAVFAVHSPVAEQG